MAVVLMRVQECRATYGEFVPKGQEERLVRRLDRHLSHQPPVHHSRLVEARPARNDVAMVLLSDATRDEATPSQNLVACPDAQDRIGYEQGSHDASRES